LLVAREDRHEVMLTLDRELGYRLEDCRLQQQMLDRECGISRYSGGTRFAIDVHWNVIDRYRPRAAEVEVRKILAAARQESVHGRMLPVSERHLLLLLFCLHTYEHELRFPSRLITWADVSELVRSEDEWDWPLFAALAREYGLENEAYLGCRVAATLLGAPVPDAIIASLRPRWLTLGLEMSCFGHWNYAIKSLDGLVHGGTEGSRTAFSRARCARVALSSAARHYQEVSGLVDTVASHNEAVAVVGAASEYFLPSRRLAPVGTTSIVTTARGGKSASAHLRSIGYKRLGSRFFRVGSRTAYRFVGPEARTRAPASLVTLLRKTITPLRRPIARVEVHICGASPAEHYAARYAASGALELAAACEAADLGVLPKPDDPFIRFAGAFFGLAPDQDFAHRIEFPLLAALDRRTADVERMSKQLLLPEVVHVSRVILASGTRAKWKALRAWTDERGVRGCVSDVRKILARSAPLEETHRVPPRIYLSATGKSLPELSGRNLDEFDAHEVGRLERGYSK
jgi:hypothetical protein